MNSADLVARLRAATMSFDWCDLSVDALIPAVPILREAADRIEALEAWKAEAMEVLRPMAVFAEKAGRFVQGRADFGGSPIMPTRHFRLTDFRAARRLVEKEEGRG